MLQSENVFLFLVCGAAAFSVDRLLLVACSQSDSVVGGALSEMRPQRGSAVGAKEAQHSFILSSSKIWNLINNLAGG